MVKKMLKKPKFKDSDGDGLSDYDEINIFGSDPYDADSNSDGIEDGEAVLNGRDPVTNSKLKDFFVPHAGNNYRPKSLHPKRLWFHAAGALAVKLVLIIFVFLYPLSAWMTPDVSAQERAKIIALTNTLRKSLSLNGLTENTKLNQAAAEKVDDMFINQYFAHLSPQNFDLEHFLKLVSYKNYITVGENLAMGYDNAQEVMDAWEKSPTHYSNLVDENFSQIGVALAGGSYKDTDTIFAAQYFGLPQEEEIKKPAPVVVKKTEDKSFKPGEKAVLSEKTEEKIISTTTASTTIIAVASTTKVIVSEPAGLNSNEKVIKVEASLPTSTKAANLEILNNQVKMSPVEINNEEATSTKWAGQVVVQNDKKSESVVPPILSVSDENGEITKQEVSNNNITPQKTSFVDQYWLFKTHPNKSLEQIFDLSSIYFKVILGFIIFSLTLSIFINIKKQHLKSIISSLSLLGLLLILIIF